MEPVAHLSLIAAFLLVYVPFSVCLTREFTVTVEAGVSDCFYHTVRAGEVMDIEYQVIDGDRGELDINFHWSAPSGRQIVSDYKKAENSHRHEANEEGDYKMCWDNTISRFNSKTVFFEFLIGEDHNTDQAGYIPSNQGEKVDDLALSITRVQGHLSAVRQMQDIMRAYEARDRNFVEGNFELVNRWSIIQVFVMVLVGGIQVYLVRSLFDDKNRVHQIWKSSILSR